MSIVILTRPKLQADAFANDLRGFINCDIYILPLIEIEAMASAEVPSDCAVIFTSANAVATAKADKGTFALCVGDATADAAIAAGFQAASVNGTASDVANHILSDPDLRSLSWLHPHGAHVAGKIAELLRHEKVSVKTKVTYRQTAMTWSKDQKTLVENSRCLFPVFSPNGANVLSKELNDLAGQRHFVAISAATAQHLPPNTVISDAPTRAAMLKTVAAVMR
ncbi:MAG: uroporphyrinogen-III synthase [Pseudomonadota bacterium]